METVALIFAMVFVGTILVCLAWTICSYIAEAYSPNNKLEKNLKNLGRKNKYEK